MVSVPSLAERMGRRLAGDAGLAGPGEPSAGPVAAAPGLAALAEEGAGA
ncbi:MAG: hypothetical protein ACYDH5_02010 [Acidimicrobiales bacterium]